MSQETLRPSKPSTRSLLRDDDDDDDDDDDVGLDWHPPNPFSNRKTGLGVVEERKSKNSAENGDAEDVSREVIESVPTRVIPDMEAGIPKVLKEIPRTSTWL